MESIIEVTDLHKAFKGVKAVNGVSFNVTKGQCFGLLGPNGAGKTTTIEMLEGIAEQDSGDILYYGKPVDKSIMDKIGIQFQNTAIQDYLSTLQTLKLFSSFYPEAVATDTLMDLCDLHDFADRDHRKLSGGQRQRLLLALALVNDPDIIFLDEPTTGLDPHARRNFWTLIDTIKKSGKTIILTTHYMDEAEHLCDDIAIMDRGEIIERGHPAALLSKHFSGALIRLPLQPLPAELLAVADVTETPQFLEFSTENIEQTLQQLLQFQVPLQGLHIKSANLDDLFLKLAGQSLGE